MNIKSLLLGSAAGVLAVTGAQAADLPVAPEPIDYVRVCDAFGAGYYYIPGTDTCLSVRGRVRAEYRYFDSEYVTHWRDYNSSQFRARGYLYMDSRTNTEFGLLRAYNEIWVTTDSPGSTSLSLWNSFIQFGGFTFGKTGSFYDFVVYPTWAWYFNPGMSDTRQLMGAYTFAFGNGFSSSIALESNEERRAYNQWGASGIVGYGPDYGGTKYPDLVANLRIDQGWGSAQLSGALHQVYAGYNAVGTTPGGELGWGVQGCVDFNLPFAAGASAYLQGAYTQGAVSYAATDVFVPLDAGDATYNPVTGDLDLATAWSVSGGFGFSFTPTVGANIAAGYVNYEDGYTSANDFSNILVNGNIQWTPVSGLVIGTEVDYAYVDADSASGVDDGSIWGASFRVQRTF